MSSKKLDLILDIAGVLATNFSPDFWRDLASKHAVSYDELIAFRKEIREELWIGTIEEEEFWFTLSERFPSIDVKYAKLTLQSYIKPLPAVEKIPLWSQYVNIHLLSNHRIEWVNHIIIPVKKHVKSVTISSEVGCCKPQVDIYSMVSAHLDENHILFVDDQAENFIAPRKLGWQTILADGSGEWMKKVDQLI